MVLEHGVLTQIATPAELHALPATPRAARFIGAHGGFSSQLLRDQGRLGINIDGRFHMATSVGVREGESGDVYIRPAGIRQHNEGVSAELMHSSFEAGNYRVYWRIIGLDEPLCSLEISPPTEGRVRLQIDGEHIFMYPKKEVKTHV